MVLLDWTKSRTALWLVGSSSTYPTYFMIGSGSGTVVSTQTALFKASDRQAITAVDGSTAYKVKWTGDWNSMELSGTNFTEWGMCLSGPSTTGSMWSKLCMPTALVFDGTTELRIEETWEVY